MHLQVRLWPWWGGPHLCLDSSTGFSSHFSGMQAPCGLSPWPVQCQLYILPRCSSGSQAPFCPRPLQLLLLMPECSSYRFTYVLLILFGSPLKYHLLRWGVLTTPCKTAASPQHQLSPCLCVVCLHSTYHHLAYHGIYVIILSFCPT